MDERLIPDLYCPKCNKAANCVKPMFVRYSVRRLQLVIFLCGDCRLLYVDKQINRRIISKWKKEGMWKKLSFNALCKEFFEELNCIAKYYIRESGYKRARFRKKGVK